MKKIFVMLALVCSLGVFTTSCRENKKTAGEKIEEAVDDTGDAIEEGAEEVEDEIDDMTDDN
ncbi:hypothetical protein [Robertkochia solimangrovi]|uniref:hypothetical protein n=1 Tax=Robertkochia solimangrovi TaxID=2213046 RepID=UPI00117BE25E|nr:hypothetical protein [Robertkochia solimangrovi]TRZ45757.1 hypothetical protein DMZ48_00310 [Robertkochia solimangrovi]